jgi:beta-galactosidase
MSMQTWITGKVKSVIYGGDYNAEQWPEEVWRDDVRLMRKAGVNLVTVGVFSWAFLQPVEERYEFGWLDRLLHLLADNSISVDLATATAAQPAWASLKYDDILPVDEQGRRISYGSRQTYCPNSRNYRRLAAALVENLAGRYGRHPALALWHINNEYGCHLAACYCENCAAEFRAWLQERYGSLERLNEAWGTSFWSQTYYEWKEIQPPRRSTTFKNPGQVLDYQRFMSDSLLACYRSEAAVLRRLTPGVPITTNFPPDQKPLDGFRWAREMDLVSWNSYPDPVPSATVEHDPALPAFGHDLMRSLKGGLPFLLMEQAPSQVNWRDINLNKRPGTMRLWSYQALARGADGVMFFQWRQSRRGAERFHSGMVSVSGDERSRTFREVAALGRELQGLDALPGSRLAGRVAILFDYAAWWAVDNRPAPNADLHYLDQMRSYHGALFALNAPIDFLPLDSELQDYDLVVAPLLFMIGEGVAERIDRYVRGGGTFVTTFFSGIVDETGAIFTDGYPGPLREVLGLQVEEFDPLKPGMQNGITVSEPLGPLQGQYSCRLWCDVVVPAAARPMAAFTEDYYRGCPCLTVNQHGSGRAYYVATCPEDRFLKDFFLGLLRQLGVEPPLPAPPGVEVTRRTGPRGELLFVLNHNSIRVHLELPDRSYTDLIRRSKVAQTLLLEPHDVAILTESRTG